MAISNGFLTQPLITEIGWDFTLGLNGTATLGPETRATSINLDCSVDTVNEAIDCFGTMTVEANTANIMMDFDSATGRARWSIEQGLPTVANDIHEMWGQEVVPNTLTIPGTWDTVSFYDGTQWRHFYYSTTWADTFESIAGMSYGAVLDIWTW